MGGRHVIDLVGRGVPGAEEIDQPRVKAARRGFAEQDAERPPVLYHEVEEGRNLIDEHLLMPLVQRLRGKRDSVEVVLFQIARGSDRRPQRLERQ